MARKHEGLKRSDWIEAGLSLLQEGGHSGLRIDGLARTLNVTKGSFYYHFECKEDFESALLKEYVDRMTTGLGKQIALLGDPQDRPRKPSNCISPAHPATPWRFGHGAWSTRRSGMH